MHLHLLPLSLLCLDGCDDARLPFLALLLELGKADRLVDLQTAAHHLLGDMRGGRRA
jgi:hypothetical protein